MKKKIYTSKTYDKNVENYMVINDLRNILIRKFSKKNILKSYYTSN